MSSTLQVARKRVRLDSICKICSGGTPKRSVAEYWSNGTIPWVKISDISSKFVASTEECITEAGLRNSSAKLLEPGTLLYSIFASIGTVGILGITAATNQAIAGLTITDDSVNRDYLFHFLKSRESLVRSSGRGAAQSNINLTILRSMEVPVPPLPVQNLIAEQLEAVSLQIDRAKTQIDKLDALVKSRFIEMFGDPVTNPMRLPVRSVEELANSEKHALKAGPFGSALKKSCYVESGYKIYGQEQVIAGDQDYGDYYIDEFKYRQLINCGVKPRDVLISLVGTVGRVLVLSENCKPGIINPRLVKVTFDESKILPEYFAVLFR